MGKRIEFLDLLKLLAILMVVFTHIFQNHIEGAYATPLYNVIWLVQMPLFMAVSGWLSSTMDKVSSASKLGKSIGRKILFYVYPCFTYIILMSAFESLRTGRNWALGQEFLNFFLDPEYGLWFLWVLWLISTIFDLGTYFASKFHFHYRDIVVPYLLLLLFSGFIVGLMFYGVFDGKILGLKLCAFYIIFYIEGNLLKKPSFAHEG